MRVRPETVPSATLSAIRRFCHGFLGLLIAGMMISGGELSAQDLTRAEVNQTVEITAHGVCRRVANNAGAPVMIPHRTSAEWVPSSPSSFLSNVPPGMSVFDCVGPEIALRAWSRPGPPQMPGQPLVINGASHGLTFTSVGTGELGSTVSLSGNTILYTPGSESWRLYYLEEMIDEVPFTAVNSSGISVTGTLRVVLVGYYDGDIFRLIRLYAPGRSPSLESGFFGSIPSETGPLNRMNLIYATGARNFDGKLQTYGLMQFNGLLSHKILIDTSAASMAPWEGEPVGDVNGDGTENTILDAQIKAVIDFVSRREQTRIESLEPLVMTTNESFFGSSYRIEPELEAIFLYEAKGDLRLIGVINPNDANPVQKAQTLLAPLRAGSPEPRDVTGTAAAGSLVRARLGATGAVREAVAGPDGTYLIRFEPSDLPAQAGTYPVSVTAFGPVTSTGTAPPGSRVRVTIPDSGAWRLIDVGADGSYQAVFGPAEVPNQEGPFDVVTRVTAPVEVTGTGTPGAIAQAQIPETLATRSAVIGSDGTYRITFPVSEVPDTDRQFEVLVRILTAGVLPGPGDLRVSGTAPPESRVRIEIPVTGATRTITVDGTGAYQVTFPASETPVSADPYQVLITQISPLEVFGETGPGALVRVTIPETGAVQETVSDGSGRFSVLFPVVNLPDTADPYEVHSLFRTSARLRGMTIGTGRVIARIPQTGASRTVNADTDGRYEITFPASELPDTEAPFLAELTYLSFVEGTTPLTHSGTAEPGTRVRVTIPSTGASRETEAGGDRNYQVTFPPSQLPNTTSPYAIRTLFRSPNRLSGVTGPNMEVEITVPSTGHVRLVSAGPSGAFSTTLEPDVLPDTEGDYTVQVRFEGGEIRTLTSTNQVIVDEISPSASSSVQIKHPSDVITIEPEIRTLTVTPATPQLPDEEATAFVLTIDPISNTQVVSPWSGTVQITTPGNGLRLSTVFSELEAVMPISLQNQFAQAVYLLSPGINSGPDPDLSRFRDTSSSGFGTPIFAFHSGSQPSSEGAELMRRIDFSGALRPLGLGGGFSGFITPAPIAPFVTPLYWDNGSRFMLNEDGSIFSFPAERVRSGVMDYRFGYRALSGSDTTCTRVFCMIDQIPNPFTVTGQTFLNAAQGAVNEIAFRLDLYRVLEYRIHDDPFADFYNEGGLILTDTFLNIMGDYAPTPP